MCPLIDRNVASARRGAANALEEGNSDTVKEGGDGAAGLVDPELVAAAAAAFTTAADAERTSNVRRSRAVAREAPMDGRRQNMAEGNSTRHNDLLLPPSGSRYTRSAHALFLGRPGGILVLKFSFAHHNHISRQL